LHLNAISTKIKNKKMKPIKIFTKMKLQNPFFVILALIMLPFSGNAQVSKGTTHAVKYGSNPKTGKYFSTGGIRLYYETYGHGKPLLLIHGNGGSIKDWRYQIPYFAQSFQVIAVDSRAQGKSVDTSSVLNYEMMADDFDALLTHLKLDSVFVIGWSDGGINALLLAIRHPEKVKKMAITGANLVPGSTAISDDGITMISEDIAKLKAGKQDAAAQNTIKLLHMMEVEPNIPLTDLQKIQCPVLVMGGDFDVIKPAHTLQIFENLQQANLWIFPASGHGTVHRYKNEFNKKVKHFLTHPYKKPHWIDWEQ
jgi:pimeloyl-ACP methyl ester carboxylesterase